MIISVIYVWMDFAQEHDPIPFGILRRNPYFFLYWLLQLIASILAFYLLLSYPPIQHWPSPFIALVAVFSSSLVLQNQLIKIGDKPVLDLSGFQKGLRLQVVSESVKIIARQNRVSAVRNTEKLAKKFKGKEQQMADAFARVMLFGGRLDTQIQLEIDAIRKRTELLGLPVEYELARIIVQTDIDYAKRLLYLEER
jgi:hypothetical protein